MRNLPLEPIAVTPEGVERECCASCDIVISFGSGRFRRGDLVECPACHDSAASAFGR
jgi:hypothetical protein